MPRVLVTGYGGFLGREIVRQLIDAGYKVRGLARQIYPEMQQLGVQTLQGDIATREPVLSAAEDCDAIIHTAAIAGVWGPWGKYYRINTAGTAHVVESAVRHRVQALVHTSSPSVTFAAKHQSGIDESTPYPSRWLCAYPQSKALAEQTVLNAVRHGTLRACALRPHLIWGNGDPHLFPRVIERTVAKKLRCVGNGRNMIDVVHVRNAARAHILALERLLAADQEVNGQAFFITDGAPVQCWEWIGKILQTAGLELPRGRIPFRIAYCVGAALEFVHGVCRLRAEPRMTRFVAAQLALDHYFSINKARSLLKYQPEVDLDFEFEQCRHWLQQLAGNG